MELHSVSKVTHMEQEGAFLLKCVITDRDDLTYECDYISYENDPYGLNPTIRQWLVDNPSFPRDPYVPPAPLTPEQLRGQMPNLTARQFRLGLVASGISPSQIDFVISQMPNGPDKDTAEIEWEYATTFKRTHPLIDTLSAALNLTPESVDTMWTNAINL